jgi:hypothetical protein
MDRTSSTNASWKGSYKILESKLKGRKEDGWMGRPRLRRQQQAVERVEWASLSECCRIKE